MPEKLLPDRGNNVRLLCTAAADAPDGTPVGQEGKQRQHARDHGRFPVPRCQHHACEGKRDRRPADAEIFRGEHHQHTDDIGRQARHEGIQNDRHRRRGHALAAPEASPEWEIVPERTAETGVEHRDPHLFAEEAVSDQHRQDAFPQVACEGDDARDKAQGGHDIGHAGIARIAKLRGGLARIPPGHELRSQKTAAEITDHHTDDALRHVLTLSH